MIPYFSQNFGNASSIHFFGQEALQAVEKAIRETEGVVLENHLKSCVSSSIRNGHDEEAIKVREIFEMWASGVHYKEISEKFNIPVSTLYEIIKNPTYIGKVRYRGNLYKGNHKGIIPEELFQKVNNKG